MVLLFVIGQNNDTLAMTEKKSLQNLGPFLVIFKKTILWGRKRAFLSIMYPPLLIGPNMELNFLLYYGVV